MRYSSDYSLETASTEPDRNNGGTEAHLWRIEEKRPPLINLNNVIFQYDNSRPHSAELTQRKILFSLTKVRPTPLP